MSWNPSSRALTIGMRCAALAAVLAALVAGCSRKSEAPAPEAAASKAAKSVPIALKRVKIQQVQRVIGVVGTLWGDEDALIASKVSGKIVALSKDVGDLVRAGEPLAQIEKTDYALAVTQKDLAVRELLAKVGLKELPAGGFDAEAVPTVQRAKLQVGNARAKFNRAKTLFEQQARRISEEEYDDVKTALEVATRNYEVEVLTATAVVEEARARQGELEIASQRLKDTTVCALDASPATPGSAPATPRIYAVAGRMVSVGEYVQQGAALYRLVDDGLVKLRAPVPERYAARVAIGQKVRVTVDATTEPFEGEVARINPQIDPANRTFGVEVAVPNPKRLLNPGAFARAVILTHVDDKVIFVPQEAIVSFAGVNKVFVVHDGRAQELIVEVGERQGDWVEVTKGLTGSESVVTAGTGKLATGVAVKVADVAAAEEQRS